MARLALSETMLKALTAAAKGDLHRYAGGYWAVEGAVPIDLSRVQTIPDNYVGTQTLQALEKRGLLGRTYKQGATHWWDPRRITDKGRQAVQSAPGWDEQNLKDLVKAYSDDLCAALTHKDRSRAQHALAKLREFGNEIVARCRA